MSEVANVIPPGFFRRTAELLFGPLVFNRRLPPEAGGGVIRVSPRVGGLKYLFKSPRSWDPDLLQIAHLLVTPDDNVWDVGANVGLFSKAAAFYCGNLGLVVSMEADNDAVKLLFTTAHMKQEYEAPMVVLPLAISDKQGILKFHIARRARAANAIEGFGSTQTGGVSETRFVPCMTLDSLLSFFPKPQVLKIDVEGAETSVLAGATTVLREAKPKIYCEVSNHSRNRVCSILKGFGYSVWEGAGFNFQRPKSTSLSTCNIVALPPGS